MQRLGGALDLALARQEGEDATGLVGERIADGLGHGIFDPFVGAAWPVANIDGERAPLAFQHRGFVQESCNARAIERCRHHQQFQVRSKGCLYIERQCKAEIRIEAALVELVEEHGCNLFKIGVVEDHPRKDALGDDEDARFRRDFILKPHTVTDRCADILTEEACHAAGGGAGGKAARFEQDDRAVVPPWSVEKMQRNEGGLARTRRRDQHGGIAFVQRIIERRQDLGDRKGRQVSQGVVSALQQCGGLTGFLLTSPAAFRGPWSSTTVCTS